MPCGFIMARRSKKTERVSTELEPELASLRINASVLSSNESPEALTGSVHHGDASSLPPRSAHQRVEPNTVDSEIGPRTQMGSTLSVPNSNDASHNYVIPPPSSRHSEMKSNVTPVPFDTLSPASTGSRRTRKKKPKASPTSSLTHSSRTDVEALYLLLMSVPEQIHLRESPQQQVGVYRM